MRHPTPFSALLALCLGLPAALPAQEKTDTAVLRKEAAALVEEGRWQDAAAAFGQLVEIDASDAKAWHMLGYTLHASGDLDRALKAHLKAAEFGEVAPVATYNVACVYALKGDKDQALEWLGKAFERGFEGLDHLATDPDMDGLRGDPRFEKLVAAAKAAPSKGTLQVYASESTRKSARVLFWSGKGSPGQVVIDYGRPAWKDEYTGARDSQKLQNRRWRMGKDFWTTLDTNIDLVVGGVEVPAGYYYLTLEHEGEGAFKLAFLDPAEVRKGRLDAFLAHQTDGGIEAPMQHAESDESADKLEIGIAMSKSSKTAGELVLRFGPHRLTADVTMSLK